MDAALAALLGAGIGAVVPAAALVIDNRANRADARTSRVFDHRRTAYAAFITGASGVYEMACRFPETETGGPTLYEHLRRLDGLLIDVKLYGTPGAEPLAKSVYDAIQKCVRSTVADDRRVPLEEKLQAMVAQDEFAERARADLLAVDG